MNRLRHILLAIVYRCARLAVAIAKPEIRGVLVAVWQDGKILLVRNSYRKGWTLPGGMLSRGETPKQAAVRETFEEVGARLAEKDLVFKAEMAGDLGPNDRTHIFETQLSGPFDPKPDGIEVVEAAFVSPQEALQRFLNGQTAAYLQTAVG